MKGHVPGTSRPLSGHQPRLRCLGFSCGVVLQQWSLQAWQPLSFDSKKLDVTQKKYLAMRHFRFLLEGCQFHVETDHKPLKFALHRTSEPWSARQQRQLSYLAEFTSDIRHVSGQSNVVADPLSRPLPGGVKLPSGSLPAQDHGSPAAPVTICSGLASLAAVMQPQEARLSLAEVHSRPLPGGVKVPSGSPPGQGHGLPTAPVTLCSGPASLAAVTQPQGARLSLAEMASSQGAARRHGRPCSPLACNWCRPSMGPARCGATSQGVRHGLWFPSPSGKPSL